MKKQEPVEETKKVRKPKTQGIPTSGLAGVAILFVCISVGYADYIVAFGTDNIINKIMLVPSLLFVAYFLVIKAIK